MGIKGSFNTTDVIRILTLIRNETENIQYVCTRPLYSELLRHSFLVQSYSLIPFDEKLQEIFLKKFFNAENVEQTFQIISKKFKKLSNLQNLVNLSIRH